MTSIQQLKNDLTIVQRALYGSKDQPRIILHMWMPPDDPRNHMTDEEIIQANRDRRLVIVPLRKWEKP